MFLWRDNTLTSMVSTSGLASILFYSIRFDNYSVVLVSVLFYCILIEFILLSILFSFLPLPSLFSSLHPYGAPSAAQRGGKSSVPNVYQRSSHFPRSPESEEHCSPGPFEAIIHRQASSLSSSSSPRPTSHQLWLQGRSHPPEAPGTGGTQSKRGARSFLSSELRIQIPPLSFPVPLFLSLNCLPVPHAEVPWGRISPPA